MRQLQVKAAILVALIAFGFCGCSASPEHKIFYINSYHQGHASSGALMRGMHIVFARKPVHLRVYFLDSERHPEEAEIEKAAQAARKLIDEFEPDAIVASDDAAVKDIIVPFYRKGPFSVVFCGVDGTAEPYGLPTDFVTGMVEVAPIAETARALQPYYPSMKKVLVLAEDSLLGRKNEEIWERSLSNLGLEVEHSFVDSYASWKGEFSRANEAADLIWLAPGVTIPGWDKYDAKDFVRETVRVPVVTCEEAMMPYAVFGLTNVRQEQGEWAAHTALDVLGGKRTVKDIPVERNRETQAYLNIPLAAKLQFQPEKDLASMCQRVY